MNEYDVKRMGLVFAIHAEIEGMKSENALRALNVEYPKYDDLSFRKKAEELREMMTAVPAVLSGSMRG